MFSWPQALIESALILSVLAGLTLRTEFRRVLRAAPRRLQIGGSVVLLVWLASQLGEIQLATYPFMSWHMYGEPRDNAPVIGYRLLGSECNGGTIIVPPSGAGLGRRPVLSFGVRRAYNDALDVPQHRQQALARTDSLLGLVLSAWNRHPGNATLCEVALQQVTIPAQEITKAPLPPYVTVRSYVGSR